MKAPRVAELLAERAETLCKTLLPQGRRVGQEWRCGDVRSTPGDSLAVQLTGERRGLWQDWATGEGGGDALDLVRAALGLGTADAIDWACRWLGIDYGAAEPHRRFGAEPAPGIVASGHTDPAARRERALTIWRDAIEDISGTPAAIYLRARGLDPAHLCSLHARGHWPATLRYSTRAALDPAVKCGALVVAVHDAKTGLVASIQRILIASNGVPIRDGRGKKRKLSLGPIAGNAARFDYWPDAGGRWGIAEGCESALAAFALTGIATWAAISAGNMPNVAPPTWARHVTIFADCDAPGMAAAGEALCRLREYPQVETARVVGALVKGGDAADVLIAESCRA